MKYYFNEETEYIDKKHFVRLFYPDIDSGFNRGDHDIVEIEYRKNSYRYRSDEFNSLDNDKKILFLGCSQTYGTGIPEEFRFSNLLSNHYNAPIANLGSPGDSIMHQVRKAFWYFRNFGNPKLIVGTFPIFRIDFIRVNNKNEMREFDSPTVNIADMNYTRDYRTNLSSAHFKKYSKAPHDFRGVIAPELAIYYSYIYLDMLDQYCLSNGINFIWSTWELQDYIQDMVLPNSEIPCNKSRVYMNSLAWHPENFHSERDFHKDCHKEFENHELFYSAADRLDKKTPEMFGVHWGIHKNIHIAEELIYYIDEKGLYVN